MTQMAPRNFYPFYKISLTLILSLENRTQQETKDISKDSFKRHCGRTIKVGGLYPIIVNSTSQLLKLGKNSFTVIGRYINLRKLS